MPKDTVEAAEFMRHGGLVVYHIYKNDDVNDPTREYWYSLWAYGSDEDDHGEDGAFDVRDLPNAGGCRTELKQKRIIREAIDAGYFDDWLNPDDAAGGTTYGQLRKENQEKAAEVAEAEASPEFKEAAGRYNWDKLAEDIAKMTPAQRQCQVRFKEPYDTDPATIGGDGVEYDENNIPYIF